MQRLFFFVFMLGLASATTVQAVQYEQGNWGAALIGNQCHVYTLASARDTSGTLIFSFAREGYNASFTYEYTPWPGETGTPWDEDDTVVLEVDGAAIWLGDEMFTGWGPGGDTISLTGGFVPDMVMQALSAQETISVALDRSAHGEIWLYGHFSTTGFADTLAQAAEWCGFNPRNLPRS